jgi:uncharacterized protein (UPF0262 family)
VTAESKRQDARIVQIHLDEQSVIRRSPEVEHERAIAIFDLLEDNSFAPVGDYHGPYVLRLSAAESRLLLTIHDEKDRPLGKVILPILPFRKLIKDYFTVCESYFQAIRSSTPSQIERLADKVEIDLNTARRLFTLICVLHVRG